MLNYEDPKCSNKIKNGTLGKLTDSNQKKPFEYIDNGKHHILEDPILNRSQNITEEFDKNINLIFGYKLF